MNAEDLISENEAIKLTGVSSQTLSRFVETGYLSSANDNDESRFVRSELQALFGIDEEATEPTHKTEKDAIASQKSKTENGNCIPFPGVQITTDILASTEDDTSVNTDQTKKITELEQELHRQSLLSEMQDKLLSLREAELEDLKKQRAWLQERVEKLEEKAERDQLLLISETQLLTKLVKQRETSSPLRKALGWLGFNEQDTSPHTTIEINKPGKQSGS